VTVTVTVTESGDGDRDESGEGGDKEDGGSTEVVVAQSLPMPNPKAATEEGGSVEDLGQPKRP
jgi:hypothetical protein